MLLEEDRGHELPEEYTMSALKQLLFGDIKKHMELKKQDLGTYSDMRQAVMTWAIHQRLETESEHAKHDMDCSNVNRGGNIDPAVGRVHWPEDAGWMQGDAT